MLDEYCNSLTDAAQVDLAIRCARLAQPVWDRYHLAEPGKLAAVNALILPENHVRGGAHGLAADMLERALKELETVRDAGAEFGKSRALAFYLATFVEPLTLKNWDELFPESVRLAFTSVFNLLAFLLRERTNDVGETRVYLSINQSLDAVLRETLLDREKVDAILFEYRDRTKVKEPDAPMLSPKGALMEDLMASVYQKIIDPTDGMPCCPKCKSANIGDAGGVYEFALMKCYACGYETYCDIYQVGDWYV